MVALVGHYYRTAYGIRIDVGSGIYSTGLSTRQQLPYYFPARTRVVSCFGDLRNDGLCGGGYTDLENKIGRYGAEMRCAYWYLLLPFEFGDRRYLG